MLGDGKSYTGIKHSGLNWGPVINKAEEAIEIGDKTVLEEFLMNLIEESFENRFEDMMSKKEYDLNDVDAARDYITAMLEFIRFSHELVQSYRENKSEF